MTVKAQEGTETAGLEEVGVRNSRMVEKTKPVWETVMSTGYHSSGPLRRLGAPQRLAWHQRYLVHWKHSHTIREKTGLDLEDLESRVTLL